MGPDLRLPTIEACLSKLAPKTVDLTQGVDELLSHGFTVQKSN